MKIRDMEIPLGNGQTMPLDEVLAHHVLGEFYQSTIPLAKVLIGLSDEKFDKVLGKEIAVADGLSTSIDGEELTPYSIELTRLLVAYLREIRKNGDE
jgi:hypothetical protein